MVKTSFKPHFPYYNPYRAHGLQRPNNSLLSDENSRIIRIADSIINWGVSFLYRDIEKQIDLAGRISNILNLSTNTFVGAIEGLLITDQLLPAINFPNTALLKISQAIAIPSSAAFLGFGIIEGIVELSNLKRTHLILKRLEKHDQQMAKLKWIKSHYFTLRNQEINKIQKFIDQYLSTYSDTYKAAKFDQIAEKILKNRFAALKSRITPELAKEMKKQLFMIMQDLKSWNPMTRNKAQLRAEKLMNSVTRQAKNKIVVHALGLIVIGITMISMILTLSGVAAPALFIALGVFSAAFVIMRFLVEKGVLYQEVEQFHKVLEQFKLPKEVDLVDLQANPIVP